MSHPFFVWFICFVRLLSVVATASPNDKVHASIVQDKIKFIILITLIVSLTIPKAISIGLKEKRKKTVAPHWKRTHKSVYEIFGELGLTYICHVYQEDEDFFYYLHRLLRKYIVKKKKKLNNKKKKGSGNRSLWRVVDAVIKCPQLAFRFPEEYDKQEEIEWNFLQRSEAKFPCCVGCIDGMLLWIERPMAADCKVADCKPKKLFCGRKKKFGLNFQGVCDAKGCFLNVCIGHPGSTSDFFAFCTSSLKNKLETPGFLQEGKCLFGNNAYVNTSYMVTPYKAVYSGEKDDYNFYHSQV
jgi:hypothetical protein